MNTFNSDNTASTNYRLWVQTQEQDNFFLERTNHYAHTCNYCGDTFIRSEWEAAEQRALRDVYYKFHAAK